MGVGADRASTVVLPLVSYRILSQLSSGNMTDMPVPEPPSTPMRSETTPKRGHAPDPGHPYHHGDLRAVMLAAAADAVARDGVAALNLRALAREVGVTHTAPRHHFGDKQGLVVALAEQGYDLLGRALGGAAGDAEGPGGLLGAGLAYIGFAWDHPGHFAVMFQPDLLGTAPGTVTPAQPLWEGLVAGVRGNLAAHGSPYAADDAYVVTRTRTAWSLVHGFATLALAGSIAVDAPPIRTREDLLGLAEPTLRMLTAPS